MAHELVNIDPMFRASSKALESVEFDRDFGGFVVVKEQSVPHTSVRPVSTWERANVLDKEVIGYPGTPIGASVVNERNTTESRLRTRYYPTNNGATVYPTRTTRGVDRRELARFADKVSVVQSYVARNAALGTVDPLTISVDQDLYAPDLDAKKVTTAEAFTTREDVVTDMETGLKTLIVSEVVYALPAQTAEAVGVGVTFKEVATGVWIKETRTALRADGTPINPADNAALKTWTWTTREEYLMPGYMYLFQPSGPYVPFTRIFLPQQRRTQVLFKPPVRFPFRALAEIEYTETLHAAPPTFPSNLRNFTGKDWVHDGTLVNINIKGILMDTTSTVLATLANDSYYGTYSETVVTQETTPINAFEYRNSLLGSKQLVEVRISRAENQMYRMLQKRVKMQGNVTEDAADVGGIYS